MFAPYFSYLYFGLINYSTFYNEYEKRFIPDNISTSTFTIYAWDLMNIITDPINYKIDPKN